MTMTIDEYQQAALRTANMSSYKDALSAMTNAALGLCGESGEVADIVKKATFQGHDFGSEKEHIVKELGDIAWYLALAASALDVPLSEVLEMNIEKLKRRYPDGFDAERSMHRSAGDI